MRRYLAAIASLVVMVAACAPAGSPAPSPSEGAPPAVSATPPETVTLRFMTWENEQGAKEMGKMIAAFEASHPNIKIKAEHVPTDYATKINTLMAANDLPDIAYLLEETALKWGAEGRLLDLAPYLDRFPGVRDRLPQTFFRVGAKVVGAMAAAETIQLFYNPGLFDKAGVERPPAEAAKAWSWSKFVEVAQKLTVDGNGKHAGEPGFDPENVVQFGVNIPLGWIGPLYALVKSNGGDFATADGTQYAFNSPEAVEVIQSLADLVNKYHVAPSPTQQANLPDTAHSLLTNRVAMVIDGQWNLQFLNDNKVNFGIGVLPSFKKPTTLLIGAAHVIFASTRHPDQALEFFSFYTDPTKVTFYQTGLWMPVEKKYYTEPTLVDSWIKNEWHPAEYRSAAVEYALNNAVQGPAMVFKNWDQISPKVTAALDSVWAGQKSAQEALDALASEVQPLLAGTWAAGQ
jgi:multiple sugar transport system substrate-binding protein